MTAFELHFSNSLCAGFYIQDMYVPETQDSEALFTGHHWEIQGEHLLASLVLVLMPPGSKGERKSKGNTYWHPWCWS